MYQSLVVEFGCKPLRSVGVSFLRREAESGQLKDGYLENTLASAIGRVCPIGQTLLG